MIDNEYFSFTRYSEGKGTPVFVLPPFAGRNGSVARNLINKCVAAGRSVYSYELKSATQQTKDLSIGGLVWILRWCHDHISNTDNGIELCGTCQGGWLAAIYASLYPQEISRLSLFAAPINMASNCGNVVEDYCSKISLPMHRLLVATNGGVQPGLAQWFAFSGVNPRYVYWDRWEELTGIIISGNKERLAKWRLVNDWYDSPNDLAGVWFLDALENHFTKNKLYDGTWNVYGRPIDLSQITCPVHVFAGGADEITCPEQARGILDKVSSTVREFHLLEGAGHTKVFTGGRELGVFADAVL